jgi:hypothetical protein
MLLCGPAAVLVLKEEEEEEDEAEQEQQDDDEDMDEAERAADARMGYTAADEGELPEVPGAALSDCAPGAADTAAQPWPSRAAVPIQLLCTRSISKAD